MRGAGEAHIAPGLLLAMPELTAMKEMFRHFAHRVSEAVGTSWAFAVALLVIIVWAVTGPIFHFSDTWQLVINTGTTIVTFLMIFLVQNTQNRDAKAIHLKLDELIRATDHARNSLVDLESLSDEELMQLQQEFQRLRKHMPDAVGPVADDVAGKLAERRGQGD